MATQTGSYDFKAARAVQTNLDNMEVGGRNLLRNTAISRTEKATQYGAWDILKPTYSNPYLLDLDEGEYVLSFDWEADSALPGSFYVWIGYGNAAGTGSADMPGSGGGDRFGNGETSGHVVRKFTWPDANDTYPYFACRPFRDSTSNVLSGITFTITNAKLERGNVATDWTPAPEDMATTGDVAANQPLVIGTQTAATRFWTGNCPEVSSLAQGQHITYFLPYAYKKETAQSKGITAEELVPTETVTTEYSDDWLKLTLSDGSDTGWVPVYYQGTTRLTSHYGAGMVIPLVYREGYSSSIPRGWWGASQYYVNNIDRTQHSNTCKAASANATGKSYAVVASSVIGYVTSLGGYQTLTAGSAIDLSYPILWGTGNVAASGTFTNAYEIYPSCTLRNNVASWSGTTYAMAYLVGTVSGNTFTLDSTTPITSTEPQSEDGYVYIPIGQLYSAYQIAFRSCKDLYAYRDGEFGPVSIREAVAASKKATDYITDIPLGGGIFIHPEDDEDNGVSITDAVDVYYDGRITASYGANGTHLYENGVEVANFTSGGAVVGQLDQMHLELANNRLAFVDENGNDAAYIAMDPDTNESVMYITRSVVVDSMQFGNWRWFSRANGNMSLKWIGPSA